MKFALIHPPFSGIASNQPPLGLAYLSAILKKQGHTVVVIDANCDGLTREQTADAVVSARPDVLGITMTTPLFDSGVSIAALVRSRLQIPVVAGGAHPSIMPEETLKTGQIDIAVRGEGEETIRELLSYWNGDRDLSSIAGISYMTNGEVVHNQPRPWIAELDDILMPDWSEFHVRAYRSEVRRNKYGLPLMSSRGCPFGCIFCYKGLFGRKYRVRSAASVVAEWEHLVRDMGVEELAIIDDNFSLLPRRVMDICQTVIDRKLVVPWTTPNGIRVSPISVEMLRKMKEAGCYRVYFGVESGDQQVLDSIGKKVQLAQVREAFACARRAGIEAGAFFMLGNLGETEETIDKTIALAKKLCPDYVQFTIATPYPGTRMHDIIAAEGKFLYSAWDDLCSYDSAVFSHGALNPDLLRRKLRQAYRSYYMSPKFVLRHLRKLRNFKDLRRLAWGAGQLIRIGRPTRGGERRNSGS